MVLQKKEKLQTITAEIIAADTLYKNKTQCLRNVGQKLT